MKEKYICIAKSYFERILDLGCEIAEKENTVIKSLKSIESFINLMSDEMYLNPPSDDVRDNLMCVKLQELETKIKYEYNKKYKEK